MRTFDEIRLEYLRGNTLRYQSSEAFFSEMYTKEEILSALNSLGIEFTERTLNYYITVGLIDNPIIAPRRKGKGKEGFFPKNVLYLIILIKGLQAEGHSLDEIKRRVFFIHRDVSYFNQLDEQEYYKFFLKLAYLLVENMPLESKTEDFLEYISLIPIESISSPDSPSIKYEKAFIAVINRLKIVNEKKQLLFDLMNKKGVLQPGLLFNSITDAIFKARIETLFSKAPKEPEAIIGIASIEDVTTRMMIVTAYCIAQFSAISSLTTAYGVPNKNVDMRD